jgi:(p)ppGpp synthase/HD superfamily hydrolase
MKLASLDDLLAEIGLGNAMSVVVAKNLQQGDASAVPATTKPRSSADQRRRRGAYHLRKMLPSDSWRPDYCARQPRQRPGYPPRVLS